VTNEHRGGREEVNELLPTEKDPQKLKELENAKKTCSSARVSLLAHARSNDDVLAQLGRSTAEAARRSRRRRLDAAQLAQAVYEGQGEVVKTGDAAKVLAGLAALPRGGDDLQRSTRRGSSRRRVGGGARRRQPQDAAKCSPPACRSVDRGQPAASQGAELGAVSDDAKR